MQKLKIVPISVRFWTLDPEHQATPAPTVHSGGGRIVIFADEQFGSGGREGILDALENTTGNRPDLIEASADLTHADLADAAVLLYHTQEEPTPENQSRDHQMDRVRQSQRLRSRSPRWLQKPAGIPRKIWVWGISAHPYEETCLVTTDPRFVAWKKA